MSARERPLETDNNRPAQADVEGASTASPHGKKRKGSKAWSGAGSGCGALAVGEADQFKKVT